MDNFFIIQPGRIGDIIIILPIAKHYHDISRHIIWPVCSQYVEMFDYVDYVETLNVGQDIHKARESALSVANTNQGEILDLSIGLGLKEDDWRSSDLSFDEWKYKEARLPIDLKYRLKINRNIDKETALMRDLGLQGKQGEYILTHSDHASCKLHYNWNIPEAEEIEPFWDYSVFDWLGVIENCKAIYCVDSCIANMINQLGIAKGKRTFRSWRQDFDYSKPDVDPKGITDPHLADGWKFMLDGKFGG